jgi:uncharacterized protein YfaS (alpha-2-macroglobulin family)
LLRVESRYQWYRRDGRWDYEPIKSTRRVADGDLNIAPDKPARLSLPVSWGRYRLEVSTAGADGLLTSVSFDAGWYAEASADTPDLLEIALDKPEYQPGETMTVAVTARTAGRLTLNVIGDRLITTTSTEVQAGVQRITLDVGSDWGNGAYLMATLRRPLDVQASHMPGRAIGIQWFTIARKAHTLALDLKLPTVMRPNTTLRIPIKVGGLTAGEQAYVTVAAVDVGILNLTNYKPPSPDDYYLGQRRLTAEIRDLYGQLIDGMQGVRGRLRSGGDAGGPGMQGSPPTQAPLAFYSGIVTVGPDGTAEVAFDIPAFAGTARVMAVAWSRDKVGHQAGDVIIRDPVVLTTTLPRFLLTGDRAAVQLELDNVEGQAGNYTVAMRTEGAVTGQPVTRTLRLEAKKRAAMSVPLTASAVGPTKVSVHVTGPGDFDLERGYPLNVNPATHLVVRRTIRPLAQGESLTISRDLFTDLVAGTGGVALSVSASTALDAATILKALDRYPFGCSEQITSRALPLLYVNELAGGAQLALDSNVDERIRGAIERLLARQDSNGSFGLWGVGGDDAWLDSYVTDFLTRARARGYAVPDTAYRLALDRLRNIVATAPDVSKDGGRNLAYALYVLARNGVAPIGDLRYLADTKLADIDTVIAKAQIAAALAMLGDRTRAERVYSAALASISVSAAAASVVRVDYGSALRDSAALVTLAAEGNAPQPTIFSAVQRVEQARSRVTTGTTTQENAWLVLAARAFAKEAAGVSLDVDGTEHRGSYYRTAKSQDLSAPLKITNTGSGTVQAVVSISGAPLMPEPAAEHGFKIERLTYTLDGDPVDVKSVKQNQRFAVVLKVTEPKPQFGRIIVADYLPAGFEIDNPHLVSSGDTGTLSWITDAVEPAYSEFRDDHFAAAFDRKSEDKPVFTVAYVVRAVSPGRYVRPQAYVEDMYQTERYGRTGTESIEVTAAK